MYKNIILIKNSATTWAFVLFWVIFTLFVGYELSTKTSLSISLLWSFMNSLFYLVIISINIRYLLPYFLKSKSPIIYVASLFGIALVLTPIQLLANKIFQSSFTIFHYTNFNDSVFIFISLVVLSAISSLVKITLHWFQIQNEKADLITKNVQTELQFLKSQINPHFLFNTLNNLYALTLKKSDLAPDVVIKLSDMLRYMLYECNEKEVALSKEIKYIQNYIELEKIRLSKNVDIQIKIEGDISKTYIAPLLIIPFIENSFKHGLKYSSSNAYLHFNVNANQNELAFYIENSKANNMAGSIRTNTTGGIGLVNVKKRLELIYPSTHSLKIQESPNSYTIDLKIKFKKTTND